MPSFRSLGSGCSSRLVPSLIGAVGVVLWAAETTLITFTTAIPPVQTVGLAQALMSGAVSRRGYFWATFQSWLDQAGLRPSELQ